MPNSLKSGRFQKGQSAVEYMLLLAAVVSVVLISFNTLMPKARTNTQSFYNKAAIGIMGEAPHCGDGACNRGEDQLSCCTDCGGC